MAGFTKTTNPPVQNAGDDISSGLERIRVNRGDIRSA